MNRFIVVTVLIFVILITVAVQESYSSEEVQVIPNKSLFFKIKAYPNATGIFKDLTIVDVKPSIPLDYGGEIKIKYLADGKIIAETGYPYLESCIVNGEVYCFGYMLTSAYIPYVEGTDYLEIEWNNNTLKTLMITFDLPPLKQIAYGTSRDNLTCKDGLQIIFKKSNGFPACVKPTTATKLIERGWAIENDEILKLEALQSCSRVPGEEMTCPSNFVCYEDLSGGLGPPGTHIPMESIGGDKKCHKECVTDNDCPSITPFCLLKKRLTEDYSEAFYLCFSQMELN